MQHQTNPNNAGVSSVKGLCPSGPCAYVSLRANMRMCTGLHFCEGNGTLALRVLASSLFHSV